MGARTLVTTGNEAVTKLVTGTCPIPVPEAGFGIEGGLASTDLESIADRMELAADIWLIPEPEAFGMENRDLSRLVEGELSISSGCFSTTGYGKNKKRVELPKLILSFIETLSFLQRSKVH